MSLDPPLGADRLTRINRDMRFARDKSPYHTRISTVVRGCYLSLSADGLYVGTGLYMPEPPTLRRLREAIAADASGRKLVSLVAALRRKGYDVGTHESVASAPRGFSADHPRLDLLRMKDIHAGKMFKPSEPPQPRRRSRCGAHAKTWRPCATGSNATWGRGGQSEA